MRDSFNKPFLIICSASATKYANIMHIGAQVAGEKDSNTNNGKCRGRRGRRWESIWECGRE